MQGAWDVSGSAHLELDRGRRARPGPVRVHRPHRERVGAGSGRCPCDCRVRAPRVARVTGEPVLVDPDQTVRSFSPSHPSHPSHPWHPSSHPCAFVRERRNQAVDDQGSRGMRLVVRILGGSVRTLAGHLMEGVRRPFVQASATSSRRRRSVMLHSGCVVPLDACGLARVVFSDTWVALLHPRPESTLK